MNNMVVLHCYSRLPDANAKLALGYVLTAVNRQQNAYSDGVSVVGDLNHVNLRTVLLKFNQYAQCATRWDKMLDCVYSNITKGHRASLLSHLGQSDHLSLFLITTYSSLISKQKPTTRTFKTWPMEASLQLQDCFGCTSCDLFIDQDLEAYTPFVLCYIRTCVENVTINKHICLPKQETMDEEHNPAFRSSDSSSQCSQIQPEKKVSSG